MQHVGGDAAHGNGREVPRVCVIDIEGVVKTSHRDNLSRGNMRAWDVEYSCGLLHWGRPGDRLVVLHPLDEAGMQDAHQPVRHRSHRLTMGLLPSTGRAAPCGIPRPTGSGWTRPGWG